MAMIISSWDAVDEELSNVEGALKRLELAIPERMPGSMRLPYALRISGTVEALHVLCELVREWAQRAREMR